jgi:hypothetical protein
MDYKKQKKLQYKKNKKMRLLYKKNNRKIKYDFLTYEDDEDYKDRYIDNNNDNENNNDDDYEQDFFNCSWRDLGHVDGFDCYCYKFPWAV